MGILFVEIYGKLNKNIPTIRNNGSKTKELSRVPIMSVMDQFRFFKIHASMSIIDEKGLESKQKLTILQPIECVKE